MAHQGRACRFFSKGRYFSHFLNAGQKRKHKKKEEGGDDQPLLVCLLRLVQRPYFFTGAFFFFGAGLAVVFFSLSRPPIRLMASAALKGNCLTDVSAWLAEFSVMSTRRLLANLMVLTLARARFRSSVV